MQGHTADDGREGIGPIWVQAQVPATGRSPSRLLIVGSSPPPFPNTFPPQPPPPAPPRPAAPAPPPGGPQGPLGFSPKESRPRPPPAPRPLWRPELLGRKTASSLVQQPNSASTQPLPRKHPARGSPPPPTPPPTLGHSSIEATFAMRSGIKCRWVSPWAEQETRRVTPTNPPTRSPGPASGWSLLVVEAES